MYYDKCEKCGAHLDPGEECECLKSKEKAKEGEKDEQFGDIQQAFRCAG